MEAALWLGDRTSPGLATQEHAIPAAGAAGDGLLHVRSGLVHPGSGATTNPNKPQPYPTVNCAGDNATSDQPDERDSFTLSTAVMAFGEGNYGRLAADQQQR